MPPPIPTPLFHITAIENLALIAASGQLLSKVGLNGAGVASTSIAYESIQSRRAQKIVPIAPGGTLHHYVPFHFAPHSPMLFTVNNGNVPGCGLSQDDIVHVTTTAQTIAQANLPFVFTDYHAVMEIASFYGNLVDLSAIDWDLFFESPRVGGYCKYWHNRQTPRHAMRMETRQAEFLVRDFVPLATIAQIGVRSENMAERVRTALASTAWTPNIQIVPGWYY